MALFGKGGMLDLLRLHRELRTARAELAGQERRVERLSADVEALRSDPAARERVAREKLGLARRGEVVFLLPSNGTDGEDGGGAFEGSPEAFPADD